MTKKTDATKRKRTPSQSAKLARERGMAGQREFAKLSGGVVVPGSGAGGGEGKDQFCNDVHLPNGWQAEVKRFREGEKTLYGWLMDTRERPDIVAMRADKLPWIVAMWGPKYKILQDVQLSALRIVQLTEDGLPNPAYLEEFIEAVDSLKTSLLQSARGIISIEVQKEGDGEGDGSGEEGES